MRGVEQGVDPFLAAIASHYGYDFSGYSRNYLVERIFALYIKSGCAGFNAFATAVLAEPAAFEQLCQQLMIAYSEMFRDPPFFAAMRDKIIPYLKSFPSLRIWHAGCGRGEEVYSMAILLVEEGLYERSTIFATDILMASITMAKTGRYDVSLLPAYGANYLEAGGKGALLDYVTQRGDAFVMDRALSKNIHFFTHNLLADQVFGQMNIVLCRNVCIYLNDDNRCKVLRLLTDSLLPGGFLGMGRSEFPAGEGGKVEYRSYGGKAANLYQKWVRQVGNESDGRIVL